MAANFELTATSDGQFMFNLKAANGEVVLTSERYNVKASAVAGIAAVKTSAAVDARYDRKTGSDDRPYFVLKSANGEPVGRSQMYSSAAAMEQGIAAVKAAAPGAGTKDQT